MWHHVLVLDLWEDAKSEFLHPNRNLNAYSLMCSVSKPLKLSPHKICFILDEEVDNPYVANGPDYLPHTLFDSSRGRFVTIGHTKTSKKTWVRTLLEESFHWSQEYSELASEREAVHFKGVLTQNAVLFLTS